MALCMQLATPAVATSKEESAPENSRIPDSVLSDLAADTQVWESKLNEQQGKISAPQRIDGDAGAQSSQGTDTDSPRVLFTTSAQGKILNRSFTSAPSTVVDAETGRTSLEWAADKDGVALDWWGPKDGATWEVYRDDKLLTTTKEAQFVDKSPQVDSNSEYSVIGIRKYKDKNGEDQEERFNYGVNVPAQPASVLGEKVSDSAVVSAAANSDINGGRSTDSSALTPHAFRETALAYNSFIPAKRIDYPKMCTPPNGGPKMDQLAGDGRSFATKENVEWEKLSSRVKNIAYITWDGKKAVLDEAYKKIGATKGYYKGKLVKTVTASSKDVSTSMTPNTSNSTAKVRFKQHATDPLCTLGNTFDAPNIDVDVSATLSKSTGRVHAVGKHDGAPSHEILMSHITSKGKFLRGCAYRFKKRSFNDLLPPMEVKVDVTVNPTGIWTKGCKVY